MINTYKGKTNSYFETGMEGVRWSVETDEPDESLIHNCIYFIKEGDYVTITTEKGEKLFDDVIVFDKLSCKHNYPNGVGSQQVAGGLYTHWIQHGFSGDEWFKIFQNNEIVVVSGYDNSKRIDEIKNTVPTYISKQNHFETVRNQAKILIPSEQPEKINHFAEYNNDINEKGDLCYNPDKFEMPLYESLIVNQRVLHSAIAEENHILVYSSVDINDNEHSKSFKDGQPISDEDFYELVNDDGLKPYSTTMFEDDDYKKVYSQYYETVLAQYQSKKENWKTFTFFIDSKQYIGAIVKLDY